MLAIISQPFKVEFLIDVNQLIKKMITVLFKRLFHLVNVWQLSDN